MIKTANKLTKALRYSLPGVLGVGGVAGTDAYLRSEAQDSYSDLDPTKYRLGLAGGGLAGGMVGAALARKPAGVAGVLATLAAYKLLTHNKSTKPTVDKEEVLASTPF